MEDGSSHIITHSNYTGQQYASQVEMTGRMTILLCGACLVGEALQSGKGRQSNIT